MLDPDFVSSVRRKRGDCVVCTTERAFILFQHGHVIDCQKNMIVRRTAMLSLRSTSYGDFILVLSTAPDLVS